MQWIETTLSAVQKQRYIGCAFNIWRLPVSVSWKPTDISAGIINPPVSAIAAIITAKMSPGLKRFAPYSSYRFGSLRAAEYLWILVVRPELLYPVIFAPRCTRFEETFIVVVRIHGKDSAPLVQV